MQVWAEEQPQLKKLYIFISIFIYLYLYFEVEWGMGSLHGHLRWHSNMMVSGGAWPDVNEAGRDPLELRLASVTFILIAPD